MSDKTTDYRSGRTKPQAIRMAVIEGHKAYVPPGIFTRMQEVAIDPLLTEMEKAQEQRRWLMLTHEEYLIARVRGLEIIVDYEMEDLKS